MTQEQLRMQMLAGIITEGQYKAKLNENDFTEDGGSGNWNGWELGYAQDDIFHITPAGNSRPWMDGRIKNGRAIITADKADGEMVEKFLQDVGNQLGATPYDSDYNSIELEVSEQDLNSLFNY
jgi:hypothetical protein